MDPFTIPKALYPTGQPARPKEPLVTLGDSLVAMAPGSQLRHAPRHNPPPANFVEHELASAPPGAPTESSGSPLTSLLPSRALTPGLARAPLAPASPVTTPALAPTEDLFRQFVQAYMVDRGNPAPATDPVPLAEPRHDISDRPVRARNPDLYYGNLHIECYHLCQQWKDNFETAGPKGHKRVPFAASFLKDRILHRWQQNKTRTDGNPAAHLSWNELKVFLRQSIGESDAFVGNVWSKMRSDSQHQLEEVQNWAAHF